MSRALCVVWFLVATAAIAAEPPGVTVERLATRAELMRRLTALHGASSTAVTVAGQVTKDLEAEPQMLIATTPLGMVASVAVKDPGITLVVLPGGEVSCLGDGDGCPELDPRPKGYHGHTEMHAPGRLGVAGQAFFDLGLKDALGVILFYPPGDGYPGGYEIATLTRTRVWFSRRVVTARELKDVDGDGLLDAVSDPSWGQPPGLTVEWRAVRFGVPGGKFVEDPKRAKPFHAKLLKDALAALGKRPELEMSDFEGDTSICVAVVEPMIVAHAHATLAEAPMSRLRKPVKTWLAGVWRAMPRGIDWKGMCPGAAAVALCLAERTNASAKAFGACLRPDVD